MTAFVNVKDFGAIGDGITNDTLALQQALNSDWPYLVIPPGVYRVSELLVTKPKVVIGWGATLSLIDKAFKMSLVNGFSCEGLTFDGNSFASGSNGVVVERSKNVSFKQCHFKGIHLNALHITHGTGISENIFVEKCTFDMIGGSGITRSSQGIALYIQRTRNVRVSDNRITNVYGQSAVFVLASRDVVIEKNLIEDLTGRGVQTWAGENSTEADRIYRLIITNNFIRKCGSLVTNGDGQATNGIFIRNPRGEATDVEISGNFIEEVGENFLEGAFVAHNNIMKNSGEYGLVTPSKEGVYPHANTILASNIIMDTVKEGIKLFGNKKNVKMNDNLILNPGGTGILVQAYGAGTKMEKIDISGNLIIDEKGTNKAKIEKVSSNGGVTVGETVTLTDNILYNSAPPAPVVPPVE